MSVIVISGHNDPEWEKYKDVFYGNFDPDDWDYMIIGYKSYEVTEIADKLKVYDVAFRKVDDLWYAVTYHS